MNEVLLGKFLLLLALLFGFTYILGGVFERLRVPTIIAALFTGIAIHYTPLYSFFSSGSTGNIFSTLANLGVLFLLFFIGLQIDLKEMKSQSKDIVLATFLNTIFPFILGAAFMLYMGYGWLLAFVIGLTRMPTAEAVIVPILDEFNLVKTRVGNFIIGAGVLDDVIEVFLVAFVSIWIAEKSGFVVSDKKEIIDLVAHISIFIIVTWILRKWILIPLSKWLKITTSNLILFTIITLFLLGGFAEYSDLGLVVGAIIAGIIIKPVFDVYNQEGIFATKAIRAVSYGFFAVIFFLWIGMSVDVNGIIEAPLLTIGLFLAAVVGKFIGIMLMVPMKKITFKESIAIGIGLNARLTTEIIVAKLLLEAKLIDEALFSALVAASSLSTILIPFLFSIIVSKWRPYLMKKREKVEKVVTKIKEAPLLWHAMDIKDVLSLLRVDPKIGLSEEEAKKRIKIYGKNEIKAEKKIKWYQIFIREFIDPLIFILMIAAAISFAIGEIGDTLTILAIVILNGILGFIQEYKAQKAIEALKKMLALKCKVIRDKNIVTIDSKLLVPGDIVLLEIGDRVPADLRLIEALNLKVDESALTGESISVEKSIEPVDKNASVPQRKSMAWMGTNVTNGYAKGVVVATGLNSEFGKIAKMTTSVETSTSPLQRKLAKLGIKLGAMSIFISALVAVIGAIFGKPLLEMFLTGVSLAVAVVPEGLPAVVTITLALGIKAMVKKHVLLRRLQAAEALGSATVICTDKTGTLTQNQMTVQKIWLFNQNIDVTGSGYDPAGHFEIDGKKIDYKKYPNLLELLKTGLICNHATLKKEKDKWKITGEPTEASLIVAAYKAWMAPKDYEKVAEFSFNSIRKRMSVVVKESDKNVAYIKGAPEVLLKRAKYYFDGKEIKKLDEKSKEAFKNSYTSLAKSGLRTLALAKRELPKDIKLDADEVEKDLVLLGVVGIIDPPRPEVLKAIKLAQSAGIKVVMITGDAALTALAIAKEIGIEAKKAITGVELDKMDDNKLKNEIQQGAVFARVMPKHKLRIVELLQKENEIVAMTGDGVNDAPALKKADIGIAMGLRGTDVAKSASDAILLDDNFASIINGVKEGRREYDNIKKFVTYLLSSNSGEVIAIFINILLGGPLILLPVQILWMNLVTDGMTAVALGVEKAEKNIMQRPPRAINEPFLQLRNIIMIILLGSYIGLGTLWLFHHYLSLNIPKNEAIALAQTVAFTGIIILEKMNVFNYRSLKTPMPIIGFFSNPWLIGAWMITVGLQVAAVYVPFLQEALHTVPLSLNDWILIFEVAAPIFLIVELYKWFEWYILKKRA